MKIKSITITVHPLRGKPVIHEMKMPINPRGRKFLQCLGEVVIDYEREQKRR